MKTVHRCDWAHSSAEQVYHDEEWGKPVHDDRHLFEMIILEGKQAGLSWATILARREQLRQAFDHFDPAKIVQYDENKIDELMETDGVIKHRLKVEAVVNNAHAYFKLCEKHGSLDAFVWSFVDGKPLVNNWEKIEDVPAKTEISDAMSKALKKEGFKFIGTTTCYAFMQAVGIVNDHVTYCDFK